MRLYFFSNHYISATQHGIQGIHSFGEIVLDLLNADRQRAQLGFGVLRDFLSVEKTVIILNGGYASSLEAIHQRLGEIADSWNAGTEGMPVLLHAKFHEEQAALNGALTSVAVLVPECSYFDARVPGRAQARVALRAKMEEHGFFDTFEASGAKDVFSPEERLALVCMSFPLA